MLKISIVYFFLRGWGEGRVKGRDCRNWYQQIVGKPKHKTRSILQRWYSV